MESATITKKDEATGAFVDTDCTITLDGHSFTAGGAWLCQRVDTGRFEGMVYGVPAEHNGEVDMVTNWDGTIAIPCRFGRVFYGNMGDKRRHVRFTYQGRHFAGLWAGIDYNQSIRVRECQ